MKLKDRIIDILLILMMIVPFVVCMVLKVLFTPATEGISVSGALIYARISMPFQDIIITEAQVNSVAVVIFVFALCLYFTRGLKVVPDKKRQIIAEMLVEKASSFVSDNMGKKFMDFTPFIASIMAISVFSSLSSLLGLFPATSDVNVVAGWAILVFGIITYYKLKGGTFNYVKGFFDPIPVFAPFNVIGELSTPVSMSFRHYGNVLSGVVISILVSNALGALSQKLLGWLPGVLGDIPFISIGIPAVLSLYFDIFSGCLQAFIFAILTMLYISNGFSEEDYANKLKKKQMKKLKKLAKAAV